MAYEEHKIKYDNGRQDCLLDRWFQNMLITFFSKRTAMIIYCTVIEFIAFLAKIGLFLILPFKFVQFFIQAWKKQNELSPNKPADSTIESNRKQKDIAQ